MITDGELVIAATTLIGPIAAVQAQRLVDRWREKEDRRRSVFSTLLATRATTLNPRFVEAFNLVPVVFAPDRRLFFFVSDRFLGVRRFWKEYLDHLDPRPRPVGQAAIDHWGEGRDDKLAALLVEMGECLDYDFAALEIKRDRYNPEGHGKVEEEQGALRQSLIAVLRDGKSINVTVAAAPAPPVPDVAIGA